MGPKVAEFEAALAARLEASFLMVDSGSNALHLAVEALQLPPGSDVVLPAFTWVACANAVMLAGHRPVFADVDLDTGNVTADSLEQARTRRTHAFMVVHYAGKPLDMDAVRSLGLPVIEDAAHAVDSHVGGERCGASGDIGVFSFDSVKNIATPGAGGVASRHADLIERMRQLRYCGIGDSGFERMRSHPANGRPWWRQRVVKPFPRVTPNDVAASIGLVQLDRLEDNQRRRREIWDRYQRALADVSWLVRPAECLANERHSYFTYLVRVTNGRRDELARHLLHAGVYTTLRYEPLHLSSVFGPRTRLPNCERLAQEGLNLPLHPGLSETDVEHTIDAVRSFA